MNTLVFVLMVTTTIDDVETTESFGAWKNINSCTYFARALSLQNRLSHEKHKPESLKSKLYSLPVNAYCIPKYVDSETTKIF